MLVSCAAIVGCAADSIAPAAAEPAAKTTMEEAKGKLAVIETNLGTIKFKFLEDKAPGHTKNFVDLAKKGFYDGTRFHRVIPGFMIQGGDPNSKTGDRSRMGTGDPGYKIKAEFNDTKHVRGIVSMARSSDPDSAGCQFFICVATASSLDNQYTAFGEVVEGMEVVDKIVNLKRDSRDNPVEENPAIMKKVTIQEN
jgi:cyclophilin family peptidyl-prolyl cis-trans isomerase